MDAVSAEAVAQVIARIEIAVDSPAAVLVDTPFSVEITGKLPGGVGPAAALETAVVVDHGSFELREGQPHRLAWGHQALEASATVELKAREGTKLPLDRRVAVHILHGGEPVGIHRRTIRVAQTPDDLAAELVTTAPEVGAESSCLSPLKHPVDLVLVVEHADTSGRFLWSAYSGAETPLTLPLTAELSSELGEATASFATDNRRTIDVSDDPFATFLWLEGRGVDIADAMPAAVCDLLVRLIETSRQTPATVLLLTEEVDVPWELAVLSTTDEVGDERRVRGPGGSSPFLGSHVSIARWPLTSKPRRLFPPPRVDVARHAIVAADYGDIAGSGWCSLPDAVAEAHDLASAFPPADRVRPRFADVIQLLEGDPPDEVLHLALHGQFDPTSTDDEGLVLVRQLVDGSFSPQYLQADHVKSRLMPRHPFVFLNACQTGAAKRVLGDYGGLAAAFVRAGASAVVAPLWNLDDDVARVVAGEFYTSVYGSGDLSAGEALRRIRSEYARDRFADGEWAPSPTRLAYQLFGHPQLRLARLAGAEIDRSSTSADERGAGNDTAPRFVFHENPESGETTLDVYKSNGT